MTTPPSQRGLNTLVLLQTPLLFSISLCRKKPISELAIAFAFTYAYNTRQKCCDFSRSPSCRYWWASNQFL